MRRPLRPFHHDPVYVAVEHFGLVYPADEGHNGDDGSMRVASYLHAIVLLLLLLQHDLLQVHGKADQSSGGEAAGYFDSDQAYRAVGRLEIHP